MKIILYLAIAAGLAARAKADPNRYQWRSFGGVNVNLQPLFSWWTFVSQATNQPLDITVVDTNNLPDISNLWAHLPARPLPEWCRVTAAEGDIMVAGTRWKMAATIEPAPMMVKHQMIYVENPPTREIENYHQALAAYLTLENEQNADSASEQNLESHIQTAAASLLPTNTPGFAAPVTPGTVLYQETALLTVSNLNATQARTQNRDAQMVPLRQFLAAFPGTNEYQMDHFALRTGRKIDGLDVYDLGTADGLTY
jgi:hypothetical protein